MAPRLAALLGLALALSLSAPARADVPPGPAPVAQKAPAASPGRRPFASRTVVVGLLAALFLVVAGAAGANDKKKPAS